MMGRRLRLMPRWGITAEKIRKAIEEARRGDEGSDCPVDPSGVDGVDGADLGSSGARVQGEVVALDHELPPIE